MGTWNSRGLRGSTLEDLINITNEKYREKGIGLVQKIPTPIKPVAIDKASRHITMAYFEQRSTVDYIGVVQGVPMRSIITSVRSSMIPWNLRLSMAGIPSSNAGCHRESLISPTA